MSQKHFLSPMQLPLPNQSTGFAIRLLPTDNHSSKNASPRNIDSKTLFSQHSNPAFPPIQLNSRTLDLPHYPTQLNRGSD
jgi:hypothetical protein